MTIASEDYFAKPHSAQQSADCEELLSRVNPLLAEATSAGAWTGANDPDTGCQISGSKGGDGDGGFRTPASTTGAPHSAHRQAQAVDVYDPGNTLDAWLTDEKLEQYDLYREHPDSTPSWVHLTTRAPGSGHRTYFP